MTWKAIDTAPLDGRIIGGVFDIGAWSFLALVWDHKHEAWVEPSRADSMYWSPTIWAPYPDDALPRK
jgi:hypothetical protein